MNIFCDGKDAVHPTVLTKEEEAIVKKLPVLIRGQKDVFAFEIQRSTINLGNQSCLRPDLGMHCLCYHWQQRSNIEMRESFSKCVTVGNSKSNLTHSQSVVRWAQNLKSR